MAFTTNWAPNQAAIAQVETYTFSAPVGIGNTYSATINGKTVTYVSIAADTAALAATGLFNLLNASIIPELQEITFANPSSGVVTATAKTAGTPFANVSGTSAGLVLSTGNGLANGIATVHTQANQSPSDVNDAQNWMRINTGTNPPAITRSLPQNGDDVVVSNTETPLLWNLDQLKAIQFNTYTRWQSFTGTVGLPENNPNGYVEWRAINFKFVGPQGSTPAGGLVLVLGFNSGSGDGPSRERYDLGSQKYTCQALAAGSPEDEYGIRLLGIHTDNVITAVGGVSIGVAMLPGEVSKLNTVTVDGGATVAIGAGVTWTTSTGGTTSVMTCYGGSIVMNAAPATLALNNGTQATFTTDALTWPIITAASGCDLTWLCGGTVSALTLANNSILDKSGDARAMTITSNTLDGDSCSIVDPLNSITYTNAGVVKQQVNSGPYQFTGTRTVKVT